MADKTYFMPLSPENDAFFREMLREQARPFVADALRAERAALAARLRELLGTGQCPVCGYETGHTRTCLVFELHNLADELEREGDTDDE